MRRILEGKFKIKVFKEPSIYTDVLVERNMEERWLKVHQGHYVRAPLEKHSMTDCIARATPLEVGLDSTRPVVGTSAKALATLKKYQGLVWKLMWLRTRADIQRPVNFLCRFLSCAGPTQLQLAKQVLRYLKGTPDMGLVFQAGDDLELAGACDADLAGDLHTSKSTTGFYLRLGKSGTVAVRSGLQTLVSDSTAMAETYAGKEVLRELIWHREFQKELGNEQLKATVIRADNQAMIAQSKNTVNHMTSKHYRIAQAFNREQVENEVGEFEYTESKENESDMFTKELGRDALIIRAPSQSGDGRGTRAAGLGGCGADRPAGPWPSKLQSRRSKHATSWRTSSLLLYYDYILLQSVKARTWGSVRCDVLALLTVSIVVLRDVH